MLYPDSVVGTDSHTTMVDGLGVAGWGVGGIEAEATMLGQVNFAPLFHPFFMCVCIYIHTPLLFSSSSFMHLCFSVYHLVTWFANFVDLFLL